MPAVDYLRRLVGPATAVNNQAEPAAPDPRAVLRLAQATASGAVRAAQDAAQVAARAQVQVDRARVALGAFDGVDGAVAAHRAGVLRGGDPANRAVPLPADLVEARSAQATARQDLVDAAAAHALLSGEAHELAATAERAAVALRAAVGGVAEEVVGGIVVELREVERQAGELRVAVCGFLGGRAVSEPLPPWAIAEVTHDAAHAPLVDRLRPSPNWPAAAATWSDFRQRLATDADATLAASSPPAQECPRA